VAGCELRGRENLCDNPVFTGYTHDGGFATHTIADARFCFPLGEEGDDAEIAPWLCAGLIGWRSYRKAGEGRALGEVVSVANLTRADAREFLKIAPKADVKCEVTHYPLARTNDALSDLRDGRLQGAAVLIP